MRIRSLVYWNGSLSLSLSFCSPFLPLLLSSRDSYHRRARRRRRSFSHPLSILSHSFSSFFLRLNPPSRTNSLLAAPPPLPRSHLPSLSSPLCSIYLSLLLRRCAVRRADPRSRTQSTPAFITRYEIARASSRFTHTYLPTHTPFPTAGSPDTTPSRYILANFANVGSCRITHLRQYRSFLRALPCRSNPHIGKERDVHSYYFSRFYRNKSLAEILTLSVTKILHTGQKYRILSITDSSATLEMIFFL